MIWTIDWEHSIRTIHLQLLSVLREKASLLWDGRFDYGIQSTLLQHTLSWWHGVFLYDSPSGLLSNDCLFSQMVECCCEVFTCLIKPSLNSAVLCSRERWLLIFTNKEINTCPPPPIPVSLQEERTLFQLDEAIDSSHMQWWLTHFREILRGEKEPSTHTNPLPHLSSSAFHWPCPCSPTSTCWTSLCIPSSSLSQTWFIALNTNYWWQIPNI